MCGVRCRQLIPKCHTKLVSDMAYSLWHLLTSCVVAANRKGLVPSANTSPDPAGRTIKRSVSVEAFCLCALEGTADFFFCLFSAHPVRTFDALAGLEVLVDLEEVLDFQAVEL